MIKRVILKNFQSHEDSDIQFGEGLNLIIGNSNSGKSSIIRGIACCVANRWDKEQVRTGCIYCYVKVQTQKGWVECKRGQGINEWKVFDGKQEKEYKSIGNGVPDEVPQILGMGQRIRGQIKELPNFMFQLQKHYMLSQIDGKKATGNLVARMMDNAIGLGGMEDLIKEISVDMSKQKRKYNDLSSQISELKSELLPEQIFRYYKENIQRCKESYNVLKQERELFDKGCEDYRKYKQLYNKLEILKRNLLNIDLYGLWKNYERDYELYKKYIQIRDKKGFIKKCSYLSEVSIEELDELFECIKKSVNLVQELNVIKKEFDNKQILLNRLKIRQISLEVDLRQKQVMLKEMKKELGYCPLCGKKFEQEDIK